MLNPEPQVQDEQAQRTQYQWMRFRLNEEGQAFKFVMS